MFTTGHSNNTNSNEAQKVLIELELATQKAAIEANRKLQKEHAGDEEVLSALKERERKNREEFSNTKEFLAIFEDKYCSPSR
ncbi:MAG: hypothetical protein BRC25_02580 [Parcubacteria group bacterium SW_6_46_9]|nr:MAG: hypothetical protein BRC25_02580 [Parcubacteria group bacterium SW_6_46_9]